jgi:cytidylate kinase
MKQHVITISREYGSGGRNIGIALAKRLGIPYYDKELLKMASEQSGIGQTFFEKADEAPSNSFLYALSLGMGGVQNNVLSNDNLFQHQSDVIREVAQKGACVIVGRCADYILRDFPGCVRLFIHASAEHRVQHVMEYENLSDPDEARARMKKMDKRRVSYHNYYSDSDWGNVQNYDLTISTDHLEVEEAVDLICAYIKGVDETEEATGVQK